MQRYRINYHWLIGFFVSCFVLAVTSYFVWSWQVERKAGQFISKAEEALAAEDSLEAFRNFFRYVQLRPDEDEVRIKMANCAVEVIKDPDERDEERYHAYRMLTQTVRKTGDSNLRLELAKITNAQESLSLVEELLAENPQDPALVSELNGMKIRSLFAAKKFEEVRRDGLELLGYDKVTEEFDPEKSVLQGETEVYVLLSQVLLTRDKNSELAEKVIEQMVAANPDSAEAYLHKSNFLAGEDEFDESKEFLNKAYELDPINDKILTRLSLVALADPKYPGAKIGLVEAITNFEDAAKEISAKVADSAAYKEAKKEFDEAMSKFEAAKPSYEEAKANFQTVRTSFDEAVATVASDLWQRMSRARERDQESYTEAKTELDKARQEYESALPHPEKALEFATKGLEEHPDNVLFYRLLAQAQQNLGETEVALKTLDDGINKFNKTQRIDLVLYKIDLLLGEKDFDGIAKEIERLKNINLTRVQPIIDFQNARLDYTKQNWADASKKLKRVEPLLFNFPRYKTMAATMLGLSYERQGMGDLALGVYEKVLQDFPEHAIAQQGRLRVLAKRGQVESDGVQLDELVSKTLELPEDEQDWAAVDALVDEISEDRELSVAATKLLRAKILSRRGRYDEAKALIREANRTDKESLTDTDEVNILYGAIALVLSDPNQGAPAAMKLLDNLEAKWGKSLRSITQRADLLVILNAENVGQQLRELETEATNLTGENALDESTTLQLYEVLGSRFERLGKYEESREYYEKLVELLPNSLPLRMHMFDLSLRESNVEAMDAAQKNILDFVGSKTHPNYILTDVRRQINRYGRREIDRKELAKSRELLDSALQTRSDWHELHITYGQLLLLLGEDTGLALQHFNDALDSGPARTGVVAIQTKLLADRGLYQQALERMRMLQKESRGRLLGRIQAEILINTGDLPAAFKAAQELAKAQTTNASTQLWYSRIAQQAGELDEAIRSLKIALEVNPSDADSWIRLVGLHIEEKRIADVEDLMRQAHLSCDPEILPLLTGKFYEMQSQWQRAEAIYLASYGVQDTNLSAARRIADFYLLWSNKDESNVGKAAVYINRILKAANDGIVEASDPNVVWARRKAAAILSADKNYQNSLKAERLLRQSAAGSAMNTAEASLLANILISRDDPKSLLEAKRVLTQLSDEGRLTKQGGAQLATLLSRTGEWDKAKSLLRDLVTRFSDDSSIRVTQINLQIEHDEFRNAERMIERLRDVDPQNPALIQLSAQLAAESGNKAQVEQLLRSILPKNQTTLNAKERALVFSIAQLAERYGAYDLAEQLYTTIARFDPSKRLDLAAFHANHGDCDKAIELMKRLLEDRTDAVIQIATRMISVRRDEHGDKYDKAADQILAYGLRDDPDSVTRRFARAEAYQTQEKYEESIKTYDEVLSRSDLSSTYRALAMNNLGFQLGLLEQRVDEAEKMVNEAIETFGPVEDMLDTRAVVRIAQQKYDLAIEDMTLALTTSNDPVKHFHLAKAYILAGDGQSAMTAWEQAKKNGFEKKLLPRLERPAFDEIRQKIESFQGQSAKL